MRGPIADSIRYASGYSDYLANARLARALTSSSEFAILPSGLCDRSRLRMDESKRGTGEQLQLSGLQIQSPDLSEAKNQVHSTIDKVDLVSIRNPLPVRLYILQRPRNIYVSRRAIHDHPMLAYSKQCD